MCGRFTLRAPRGHPWLEGVPQDLGAPRYNIAPTQQVLLVGQNGEGRRVVRSAHWGFRPRWLPTGRRAPINARADSAADKPMFRKAYQTGRCLVPADGWYEWQARESGPKQPYFFHRPDDGVFWLAGLAARDPQGRATMAILTTDANAPSARVHERMPVVIPDDEAAARWIEPETPEGVLRELLVPVRDDYIEHYPISRAVNRPENDNPRILQRLSED